MIKGVNHAHLEPIWHHSEASDIPYSPNQFLDRDLFCHFLQQRGSSFLRNLNSEKNNLGLFLAKLVKLNTPACRIWHYRLWSFRERDTKLERKSTVVK